MRTNLWRLLPAFVLICLGFLLLPSPASAQEPCGGPGQRGCCVGSTERLATGACSAGLVEAAGCTAGNCACGGSGISVFLGLSSSSMCEAVSTCGGPGQRACCITETRWDNNPIPASGGCRYDANTTGINGLTEVAGGPGAGLLCGGSNPFGIRSNGTCQVCGTEGAQACVNVPADQRCQTAGLTPDLFGICRTCGGDGQSLCGTFPTYLCAPGFHPDGGVCRADRVIAEPDCNCTPVPPAATPAAPIRGYADLHLHMFANLAFGGLTVWGDAFDKAGGVSQALRSDNFAQRTSDRAINGRVVKGLNGDQVVNPDGLRAQTLIHGDLHADDIIGFGTGQHGTLPFTPAMPNGGVEWDPAFTLNADFAGWPKWNTTTHQQAYYKWLERAYVGGLRLVVLLGVNNEAMCASQKRFADAAFSDCSDTMPAVKLQFGKAQELETWLGDQCRAGVGTACARQQPAGQYAGWFKIVTSPAMARAAIARGQLAVVLGIEDASLFGCKAGVCTPDSVRQAIDDYHALGVRHIFPIHNFDNGFGGAATWMDTIAIGNAYATTEWYAAADCPATPAFNGDNGYGFKLFAAAETDFMADFSQALSRAFLGLDAFNRPTYPGLTTTCNQKGLTSLGSFLVREMMHRKMIIDVDHMSIRALDQTLSLAEANSYPGIVASHVLMFELADKATRHERMRTRDQLQRIAGVGGMIAAMTQPPEGAVIGMPNSKVVGDCPGSATTWAQMYEYAVDAMTINGVKPAIAFGTDFNGISAHNKPRFGSGGCAASDDATRVSYPFTLTGFGTFAQQQTGARAFDFNTEGLAHVGLLPDMVEDLKKVGLANDLDPLFGSAEAYIRMWEQAEATGVAAIPISTDTVPPSTSVTQAPPKNSHNWNNTSVIVSLQASDGDPAGSGVVEILHSVDNGPTVVTQGATAQAAATREGGTVIRYAARDLAGNQEFGQTYVVAIDTTVPTITGSRLPLANGGGWNNSDVTATFNCGDARSGVDTCSSPVVVTAEGAGQQVVGTALDRAGNTATASVTGISIDRTAPSVIVTGVQHGAIYTRGSVPSAGCQTSDPLSGVSVQATVAVSGGTSAGVGQYTVVCSGALDVAGNAGSATATYHVHYDFSGFFEPVENLPAINRSTAGSTIPLKFGLNGSFGLGILAAGIAVLCAGRLRSLRARQRRGGQCGRDQQRAVLRSGVRPVSVQLEDQQDLEGDVPAPDRGARRRIDAHRHLHLQVALGPVPERGQTMV